MNQQLPQKIHSELATNFLNLRAETVVAEIIRNADIGFDDIDVFYKSNFSRAARRDIIDAELDTEAKKNDYIKINLSRNGLYDALPEGMFHQPVKRNHTFTYSALRNKNKAEEKSARKFFAPLENAFFRQQVKIEELERSLLDKVADLSDDFFIDFWKLDKDLPRVYLNKLIKLLPYVHKIAGDFDMTARCLETIIGNKVELNKEKLETDNNKIEPQVSIIREDKTKEIASLPEENNADFRLGVNLTLSTKKTLVKYPNLKIIIGPLNKTNINAYTKDGEVQQFIRCFCNYFIPMEFEYEIIIQYNNKEQGFVLNESDNPTIGLTTIL